VSHWQSLITSSTVLSSLFIIYINDLIESCGEDAKIYLFADDARLYNHVKCIVDAEILQSKNDKFTNWAHRWLVNLSTKKCKSMSFHQRQYDTTNNSFTYKIDGVPLEHVESYKDLGVLFDPFLLFDQHISNIVSKAYSMLGLIQLVHRPHRSWFICDTAMLYSASVARLLSVCWSVSRGCIVAKWCKIVPRLLLITNRKSHIGFQMS